MPTPLTPITVETVVNVPVEKAWTVWTEPAHITQWNAASPDWHTPRATNDLRTGGSFLARMEARDGSSGFDFAGVYTDVKPYRSIAYTMEDGRTVTVRFSAQGKETKVTETFDPETENSAELQRDGWQAILDNYKQYAESLP